VVRVRTDKEFDIFGSSKLRSQKVKPTKIEVTDSDADGLSLSSKGVRPLSNVILAVVKNVGVTSPTGSTRVKLRFGIYVRHDINYTFN
jgi:hypothetical protein